MFDSRKHCPQCDSEQLKYQAPKAIWAGFVVMMVSVFITLSLLTLAMLRKPAPVDSILNLAGLFIVLVIPITGLVFIMILLRSRKSNYLEFKCGQCGYQWSTTKEEWLQKQQQKKEVVESLINQIKKM